MVAANTSTPPEVLAELANDEERSVRENVAENIATTPSVLRALAGDQRSGNTRTSRGKSPQHREKRSQCWPEIVLLKSG